MRHWSDARVLKSSFLMSGAGPLIEVTYRKLAFVKNGDDGNDLVDLNVKDGVVLDAETQCPDAFAVL